MTDDPRFRTILLAASITDGEKFSGLLEAKGDRVLIVTPRTTNRLRGYLADRVLHTPKAFLDPAYKAMHALALKCLPGRHLTVVES